MISFFDGFEKQAQKNPILGVQKKIRSGLRKYHSKATGELMGMSQAPNTFTGARTSPLPTPGPKVHHPKLNLSTHKPMTVGAKPKNPTTKLEGKSEMKL